MHLDLLTADWVSSTSQMLISGASVPAQVTLSSCSSLSSEVSLKDTRLILTGLGGTIKKGIPENFSLSPPTLISASKSLESALKLLRLCEGEMLGVGCITLISMWRPAVRAVSGVTSALLGEEEEEESFS